MAKAHLAKLTRSLDAESRAMLYEGLNISQLEILLEMNARDIATAIEGKAAPCGYRNGVPIYKVKEVIPWVVKPNYDVEQYIRDMHPSQLPKMLSKEFWNALRAKQEYEFRSGDLWPTTKVVEAVGDLMKLVRMSVQLTTDAVERRVELTEQQYGIIRGQMDGMLLDLYSRIQETFKDVPNGIPQKADDDEL